jgi:hypothetical protein
MKISTEIRLQYMGLAIILITLGFIFGNIGYIFGFILLFVGQIVIFYTLSSKTCPYCGNNFLSASDEQQKFSTGYQSALLNIIAGKCSVCKSRL